jgi:hypothetical protein
MRLKRPFVEGGLGAIFVNSRDACAGFGAGAGGAGLSWATKAAILSARSIAALGSEHFSNASFKMSILFTDISSSDLIHA